MTFTMLPQDPAPKPAKRGFGRRGGEAAAPAAAPVAAPVAPPVAELVPAQPAPVTEVPAGPPAAADWAGDALSDLVAGWEEPAAPVAPPAGPPVTAALPVPPPLAVTPPEPTYAPPVEAAYAPPVDAPYAPPVEAPYAAPVEAPYAAPVEAPYAAPVDASYAVPTLPSEGHGTPEPYADLPSAPPVGAGDDAWAAAVPVQDAGWHEPPVPVEPAPVAPLHAEPVPSVWQEQPVHVPASWTEEHALAAAALPVVQPVVHSVAVSAPARSARAIGAAAGLLALTGAVGGYAVARWAGVEPLVAAALLWWVVSAVVLSLLVKRSSVTGAIVALFLFLFVGMPVAGAATARGLAERAVAELVGSFEADLAELQSDLDLEG